MERKNKKWRCKHLVVNALFIFNQVFILLFNIPVSFWSFLIPFSLRFVTSNGCFLYIR